MAAIAFKRGELGGFFAALVGAGAAVDDHLELFACAEDVIAQEAPGLRLGDGAVEPLRREVVLAAHVDERPLRLDGVARQDDPLDQLVRVVLHDHPVFEGARLRFVGVDDQVARVLARGEEAPLLAGREARAAAAAHVGGLHLVDDLLGVFPPVRMALAVSYPPSAM